MAINEVIRRGERLAQENSTAILTAVGVTGTITTAVLSGRASFKAGQILLAEEERGIDELDMKRKLEIVWPLYIPAVGVGSATIASIIMANRLGTKKAAAMAAAYGLSERAFTEYREKVVEKLGEGKERAMRDEIMQERVDKNPVKQVIIAGSGDVLCYDNLTGRYFTSSIETIKQAVNTVNYDIIHHMYASLSSFYEEIGLPPTRHSDEIGWNTNNLLEVVFSTTMSSDNRPCIVMDFQVGPTQGYEKLY